MQNPKYELFRSTVNYLYYFRLKASNGEIILSSEAYSTKYAAQNGIDSVRVNAPFDSRYERRDSYPNYTFNLKAANGEIIGRSEVYKSISARENGIDAVKRDAPKAPVEDLT